jgi:hypothetical protein
VAKKFYTSKTFWFNVLALLTVVATSFGFGEFAPDEQVFEYGAVVVTLVNVVLRFLTKGPVEV